MEKPQKPRYFLNSLAKGLRCLQVMAAAGRSMSLSEIAKALETNKASATRFCYTLTELGFMARDERKCYQLTPNILTLGYPAVCDMGWRDIAKYHLRQLFEDVNHTVSLSVLDGNEIVFLIRFRTQKHLPFDIRMGTKLPVHCTAMGKVLMAMGDPRITRPVLNNYEFKPLTVHSITDRDVFRKELEKVRRKGYALNDEELSTGNRSIGAPVLDESGFAVAAIVISVPTSEFSLDELEENFADRIVRTAHDISQSLLKVGTAPPNGGSF